MNNTASAIHNNNVFLNHNKRKKNKTKTKNKNNSKKHE